MTDQRPRLPCPHPECDATLLISLEGVEAMPTWGQCICGACRIACYPDEAGAPALARLVTKPLRKGDRVLVRHTSTSLSYEIKERFTVEAIGRGGKKPRYADGSPVELRDVVGVLVGV